MFLATGLYAQGSFSERDVYGVYEFKIDIKGAIEEEAEEMNFFERMVARSVSGLVETALEEVHITFDFRKNNVAYLTVVNDLDDEETETEELYWEINDNGQIEIDDIENENVQMENDGYWVLSEDRLISVDEHGKIEPRAWMQRVK